MKKNTLYIVLIMLLAAVNTAWGQENVTSFDKLKTAIEGASNGDEIILYEDIELTGDIVANIESEEGITLELNGNSLTAADGHTISLKPGAMCYYVDGGNSVANAEALFVSNAPSYTTILYDDMGYYIAGNVTSPAGKLTLGLAFVYTDVGEVIKLENNIIIDDSEEIIVYADQDDPDNPDLNTYILDCNGKSLASDGTYTIKMQKGTIIISNQQLTGVFSPDGDPAYLEITEEKTGENEWQYKCVAKNSSPSTGVAKIGDVEYATLEAALAAATTGQTIELMNNISLSDRLFVNAGATPAYAGTNNRYATTTENKSITLDLKGYNITSSNSNIALAGGSLNITNTGTADATHGVISTTDNGLAPIEVRGTGDLTQKRTLTIGTGVTLSGDQYGLNVFGSNDAQKNIIDVNVNGTVNGILFVLGNLTNDANEINIVVNGKVDATNAATGEKPKTGIALQGNANVTVNDNAEVTGDTGIEVRAGNLTVNGGAITGATDSYSYTANGSGTTTKGAAVAVAQHTTAKPINVQLNGGTLAGKELIGVTDVNENKLTGVNVTAVASFVENKATSLPANKAWGPDGNGKYTIVPAVASIDETGYATLEAALAAATAGQKVKLLDNINTTSQIVVDKQVTLDLNGKTIAYTGTETLASGVIGVKRGGNLTIQDASGNNSGKIESGANAYAAVALTIPGESATGDVAELKVKSGTLSGDYYAITGNGSRHNTKITIEGGVIKGNHANDNLGIYHPQDGVLNISGGEITGYSSAIEVRSGTLNITGGTFTTTATTYSCNANGNGTTTVGAAVAIAQHTTSKPINASISGGTFNAEGNAKKLSISNPQNNTFNNVSVSGLTDLIGTSIVIPDDYEWVDNGSGTSSLQPTTPNTNVAKIGETEYATLEAAIAAATTGQTIELINNINTTSQIVVDKQVTLDLNGKTIAYTGTETLTSGVIGVKRGGNLTIQDASGNNSGKIESGANAYAAVALTLLGESATGDVAELTVKSGTLSGDYYAITGNGSRHNTKITIEGGVIKGNHSNDNLGIYHPQDGELNISGGEITGYNSAIEVRSGKLNITGGTFTTQATTYSCNPNGSGTTTVGAAVAIAQHTTNKPIEANIEGGTFNIPSTGNAKKLSISNPQNNTFDNVSVSSLTNLIGTSIKIPAGYCWVENEQTGVSTLTKAVASITDGSTTTYYPTLQAAIDAFTDVQTQTIELLQDIEISTYNDQLGAYIGIQKSINIDGKGFTIKRSGHTAEDYENGANEQALTFWGFSNDPATVNISNLTIYGFARAINAERLCTNVTFNITNCNLYGRAGISNWGPNNTFNITGGTIKGYNKQNSAEDFYACIVDNNGSYIAENGIYNLNNVAVTAKSDGTAQQNFVALRGINGAVTIKGSTTFAGDPTSLCGFIEDENDLGSIYFDAAAKSNTADGNFNSILNQMLKEISDEAVASGTFAGLYPIGAMSEEDMPVVEISGVYFWSVKEAFKSPQFVDGAELIFKKDATLATLTEDITASLTSGTFTMTMDGHKLTAGDYHINLQSGVTAKTDVQVQAFGSNESGKVVKETKTNDGYEYSLMSEGDAIAKIGNNNFTSLKDALEAVNDGETITLVGDNAALEENFTLTLTDEAGAGKHQDGQFTIDLNGKSISGNGKILLPLKYTVNTNVTKEDLFGSAVDGMTVSETKINDNLYAHSLELVARIGDVYFTSINAAVEAAQEGDKIIVIKGLEEDKPITINQTVVINKGITLEGENNQPFYLKLANDYTQKSAFRIVGSTTGDIFFNKMNLKTEIDGYVDNDPASQTYGKFITRATSGGAADGNAMGVVVDQYYSGSLTFNDGELCTDNRAINVVSIGKGFELNLNGTTITTEATKYKRDGIADNDDFDTSTMYINENMDTGEGRAINFSNDAVNATVNITNSTIEGFAYALNIAENSGNLKVNMKYGTIYARAPFNNWGDYSQFKIENVIVNGMNIEDENPNNINIHESYAAFCDNESANFNIYDIKDVTVKASVVGDAYNGSEMFINLRGNDAKVHILGGTTYEGEAMPKGGFTDSYTDNVKETSDLENMIDNNYVWFDDDTKVFFTPLIEAHDIVSIADEKDNTQFYPLIRKPTYAIRLQKTIIDENAVNVDDKFIVTNYYFNTLEDAIKSENFESSVILTLLQDNVPLNEDITPNLEDGEYFTLRLKDDNGDEHSFVGNDHHILLNPGVSVNYDVACQELFDVTDKELTVLLTEVPGEYVAGNVTYTWKDNENNITTSNGLFSDLFDLDQLENESVVTLKKDITLADTYTIEYKTDGFQNGDSFTIIFGDFDITPGENSIALPNGFTVHTDKETYMFSTVDPAMNIIETIDANGYHYTPGAAVAKIDRKYYTTIEAAFAAVPTDGTETKVELLVDLENNQEVTIPSGTNIIFDLGGHTYTTNATNGFNFADDEKTSLTVQNGEIDANSSNAAIRVAGKGNKLTIASDATVKNDGSNAKESIIAVMGNPSTDAADKNVVNIYGKLLTETAKVYGIAANGLRTTNADINVYDGSEVTSTNDIAIFLPGGATVTTNIEGGTITGTTGIYAKSGVLNINGGTINGTGAQKPYTNVGNSAVATGDGLVIDNCGYPGGTPVVTVAGGDFNSTNAEPIASYGKDDSFEPVKKFVYGGTFNKQINAEYPAEGYYCPTTTNEDNRYYITTGVYEAKIGNKGYETFKKAVDAAGDDLATTIIELLSDVKVPYTMSNPDEILKVKLNGKKLTVNPPSSEYEVVTDTDDEGVTTYSIKKSINKVDIAIKTAPTTYTGQEYTPTVIITDVVNNETVTLVEGTDYTFTYDHNYKYKDAKTYSDAITITGKGAYAGTRTIDYIVLPRDIADCQVTGNTADFRPAGYSAAQIAEMIAVKYESIVIGTENEETPTKFTYTLKKKGTTLPDGEKPDYKVEVDFTGLETVTRDNVEYIYNIGVYEDIITLTALEGADGTQNFVGNRTVDFTILPDDAIDISKNCVVTSDAIYTSTALPPTKERIHVIYKDPVSGEEKELTANDYDLEVHGTDETYIDAQTYSNAITIIAKINTDPTYTGPYYYGTFVADYVIAPRDLADAVVTVTKVKDMNWSATDNDLSDNIVINGTDATTNNINLFMEPATGIHYNLQNKDAVVGENPAPAVYDYSYTVEPSPMKDPGEYKVIFTGRGNFTGMTEVKIAVLKDINLAEAEIALQVIPGVNETPTIWQSGTGLNPETDLQGVVIKDGDNVLVEDVHYTIVVKGESGTTYNASNPIKNQGLYYAHITPKYPYYTGDPKVIQFPAVFEYYTTAAGNVSPSENKFGIHVTSGIDKTATVGALNGVAVDADVVGLTIDPTKTIKLGASDDNKIEVELTINGIDDNAFNGENNLHYIDATALEGYEPTTLSRTENGPFNGIAKQAIVYLNGDDVYGENYVYETAAGDFRCDLFKIYDDVQGNQKGFTDEDYKWEIINKYEFTAATLTNTRMFNKDQHYTTCLPYDLPLTETMKAYTLTAASNNMFGFREIDGNTLTAFMPYVLIPSADGNMLSTTDVIVKKTDEFTPNEKITMNDGTTHHGYQLNGSTIYLDKNSEEITTTGLYIMQSGNQWKRIPADSDYDGPCVLPMRAYISYDANGGSREFMGAKFIDAAEKMATDMVGDDWNDAEVYDLQGRKVDTTKSSMRKGVYIVNGQKRIRK